MLEDLANNDVCMLRVNPANQRPANQGILLCAMSKTADTQTQTVSATFSIFVCVIGDAAVL